MVFLLLVQLPLMEEPLFLSHWLEMKGSPFLFEQLQGMLAGLKKVTSLILRQSMQVCRYATF